MLDGEIPPSDFEISNNNDKIRKYRINIKLLNEYRITDKYKVIEWIYNYRINAKLLNKYRITEWV